MRICLALGVTNTARAKGEAPCVEWCIPPHPPALPDPRHSSTRHCLTPWNRGIVQSGFPILAHHLCGCETTATGRQTRVPRRTPAAPRSQDDGGWVA
jgi:hypothetical protein